MSRAGSRFESAVRDFLASRGLPAIAPHQSGFSDLGDLQVDPFVLQCKDYANVADAVREATEGAQEQAGRVVGGLPAGVVRRRGRGTGDAYVVMSLSDFARLAHLVRNRRG